MLAIKTVPVASFIIVALIWFSSKKLSILISFLMVLPIIYTNVQSGILAVDRQLIEMARVFHVPLRTIRNMNAVFHLLRLLLISAIASFKGFVRPAFTSASPS